ncbi:non-heme iron oxygenase ferredoxin subunit [Leptospira sp. 2 VSF19]|uniref:Non-heme iron oxygenase ferredoxin subunit n=1 Tax=Leptospira soteropolitanensis TaxID=2950025 RepID=A0AAW5VLP8_9LEPT|nr:non-heme iron oxygenase ferredoxin subunit [Leptospira soteropolitanensis]MCW7493274.1 non-heme iron oxygenase ferredoxin subunit [Leptospira soteropolitanensis]MCW7500657.1 non-heme iron oxygenase ferredoxin subunit [Leptospira soteropolitanensis]MCW7523124.1 non-heme iron oxygenase ferredoxin subunit [Leptospira soteropolitanensis]MCW7526769.1 non-heme iron oxygenase ferredoxin subunit [Leptospira soteropolitanensis]MCW7530842.1 non-heme iron oxygenase ferredoxin subunit [Leptospira soter
MAFKKLIPLSEVGEGKMAVVKTRHFNVVVTKVEGEYFAFEDSCTHDGEEISCGKLEGCVITCPRHFAKFDVRTGKVLALPATEPLVIFPVRVVGEDLEVDLEAV